MWSIESSSPLIVCSRCGRVFEKMWSVSPSGGQIKPKRTNQILRRQRVWSQFTEWTASRLFKDLLCLGKHWNFPNLSAADYSMVSLWPPELLLNRGSSFILDLPQEISSRSTQNGHRNWLFYMFGFFLCNFHFLSIYKIDFHIFSWARSKWPCGSWRHISLLELSY